MLRGRASGRPLVRRRASCTTCQPMTRPLADGLLIPADRPAVSLPDRPPREQPRLHPRSASRAHPYPEHLIAAPAGSTLAWTFNERGRRNIFIAEGPSFTPRRLTNYDADDGQELTSLSFSDDGRYVVYLRGGGPEPAAPATDGNPPPEPVDKPVRPPMEVWSIAIGTGDMKKLGEGDAPAIAPRTRTVAFVRDGRIWIVPIDGSKPAASIFVRGGGESVVQSPDGAALASVSNRGDAPSLRCSPASTAHQYLAHRRRAIHRRCGRPAGESFVQQAGALRAERRPDGAALDPGRSVGDAQPLGGARVEAARRSSTAAGSTVTNLRWGAADRLCSVTRMTAHLYSAPAATDHC